MVFQVHNSEIQGYRILREGAAERRILSDAPHVQRRKRHQSLFDSKVNK
jgi:hypothetical protein